MPHPHQRNISLKINPQNKFNPNFCPVHNPKMDHQKNTNFSPVHNPKMIAVTATAAATQGEVDLSIKWAVRQCQEGNVTSGSFKAHGNTGTVEKAQSFLDNAGYTVNAAKCFLKNKVSKIFLKGMDAAEPTGAPGADEGTAASVVKALAPMDPTWVNVDGTWLKAIFVEKSISILGWYIHT